MSILLVSFLLFSCTIIVPIDEEGSKLLEDGLWRLYVDTYGFGRNVDINNHIALVSAKGDSTASAHVFEYIDYSNSSSIDKWNLTASFSEEDATQNYASEISVGENIIAISDYDDGKVYTYIKSDTTWEKLGVIVPPNESEFSNFGKSLDIYENYLIVGSETGPAVLYEYINDSWLELTSLDVGDQQENIYQIEVCISENFLATCKGMDIYVYNKSGSVLSNRTLIDSSINKNHSYYYRIDLDDSTLVVGDPTLLTNYCGVMVYRFENNNWIKNTTIEWFIERDDFGNSIAICSDHILFAILSYDLFSSNSFTFYSLSDGNDSSEDWVYKEDISGFRYRGNFALSNEFAILSGRGYAYIYEYK